MILDMNIEDWKKVEDSLAEALAPVFKEIFKIPNPDLKPKTEYNLEDDIPEDKEDEDEEVSLEDRISALEDTVYRDPYDLESILLDKQSELIEELEKIEEIIKDEDHPILREDIGDLYKKASELTIKINFIDELLMN